MPCTYDTRGIDRHELEMSRKDNERLTRLLCEACRTLSGDMSPELIAWWKQHKKEDASRIRAEKAAATRAKKAKEKKEYLAAVKERLMNQLTDEEKQALGIKK